MPIYMYLKLNLDSEAFEKIEKAAVKRKTSVEDLAAQLLVKATDRMALLLDEPKGK